MATKPQKVFIDTDIGNDIDDAFALAFALQHPDLEVLGISVVGEHNALRARLARLLLASVGQDHIPVWQGLERSPTYSDSGAIPAQLEWAAKQAYVTGEHAACQCNSEVPDPGSNLAAWDALHRVAIQNPDEVTLVCLGRLTNVAVALQRFPDLEQRLRGLAIMGGEVDVARREHNFAQDYLAADYVLRSSLPIFLATWSVGSQLTLDPVDLQKIWLSETPLATTLHSLQKVWCHIPVLYDVIPFLWLVAPELVPTQSMALKVETTGQFTRGMTVDISPGAGGLSVEKCLPPDLQLEHVSKTQQTAVSRGVKIAEAKELFLDTVRKAG